MALPKKKLSRTRRNRRRAHDALGKILLVKCPDCGSATRPHTICPNCGKFRGVEYLRFDESKPAAS